MSKIDKMVDLAVFLVRDANLGYDQANRWDFPEYGDTEYAGETDCSALVYHCAVQAGYNVPTSGTRYTGTEIRDFTNAGFTKITAPTAKDKMKKGDILYKDGHTAIWTGEYIAEAYGDENGGIKYGKAGDQLNNTSTGETRLSPWRSGWLWVLRPPEEKEPVIWPQNPSDDMKPCDFVIEEGAHGDGVKFDMTGNYSYRWEKWASGKLVVYLSDYFGGGTGKYYSGEYFIEKPLDFPEDIKFVEPPRVIGPTVKASSNLLGFQVIDLSSDGLRFWISGPNKSIPKFSLDVELIGSWK